MYNLTLFNVVSFYFIEYFNFYTSVILVLNSNFITYILKLYLIWSLELCLLLHILFNLAPIISETGFSNKYYRIKLLNTIQNRIVVNSQVDRAFIL